MKKCNFSYFKIKIKFQIKLSESNMGILNGHLNYVVILVDNFMHFNKPTKSKMCFFFFQNYHNNLNCQLKFNLNKAYLKEIIRRYQAL